MPKPVELPTFGRLGHLTPEQEAALIKLRRELVLENEFIPERHDDHLLLRFLRARRFDVAKSKDMLLNCEKWRKEFKVDELTKSFTFPESEKVAKLYPQFYHKTDRLGRPVYVEQLGKLNVKELFNVTTVERMQQKLVVEYEKTILTRFAACSKISGKNIEQSCTILDLDGVSLMSSGQVLSIIREISKIGQDYYPELLGTMFIVNAPMLFSSVWSLIKPFLDENTVKKIHILGSSYKTKLFEYVDPENCPEVLQGKSPVPSDGFPSSDVGPWNNINQDELDKEREQRTQKLKELAEKIKAENTNNSTAASSN